MKKAKFISAILLAAMAVQLFSASIFAKIVPEVNGPSLAPYSQPLSIKTENVENNKLQYGSFDDPDCLDDWDFMTHTSISNMRLEWLKDENGGYLRTDNRSYAYFPFYYNQSAEYESGIYRFIGYFRTYNPNELTSLRIEFFDTRGTQIGQTLYVGCGNEWQKVEYYMIARNGISVINVMGGAYGEFSQDFCMDEFSLVKVDKMPSGFSNSNRIGLDVAPEEAGSIMYKNAGIYEWNERIEGEYELNGIMMNHDADSLLSNVGKDPDSVTVQDITDLAMQYEGSQVTDMMLCVNTRVATYPSKVWTSHLDKYYQTSENGTPVDYSNELVTKGAHHLFETLGIDYIDMWCDIFRDIGINPWISFRMNDAHDHTKATSVLLSDFFHENPDIRRIRHHSGGYDYMDNLPDYTFDKTRDHMLELINEALDRYDCYGIELDFQREMYLWHIGGEYRGLDILTDFVREINKLVKVYEEKYSHEIKVAVRVASDPMTCYELGFDIVTWAAEGLIDHLTASGRFETTDTDIPIRLWKSMIGSYGVTLAAAIDTSYIEQYRGAWTSGLTIEMIAGIAANAYSQGADKIYYMNLNTILTDDGPVTDEDKISITYESNVDGYGTPTGARGKWIIWNTIGSYEKCIGLTRRCIPTYNDTRPAWRDIYLNEFLPLKLETDNVYTMRIPVGDVTEGSKLTFMISAPKETYKQPPTVYVNSELCTFIGVGNAFTAAHAYAGERSFTFTDDRVLLYDIPVAAHDDGYMIIEVSTSIEFTTDHVEVYVQPAISH